MYLYHCALSLCALARMAIILGEESQVPSFLGLAAMCGGYQLGPRFTTPLLGGSSRGQLWERGGTAGGGYLGNVKHPYRWVRG